MNYVYQFDLVNYSTGPNGVPPADQEAEDDANAVRIIGPILLTAVEK